jgi:hypothetical protein
LEQLVVANAVAVFFFPGKGYYDCRFGIGMGWGLRLEFGLEAGQEGRVAGASGLEESTMLSWRQFRKRFEQSFFPFRGWIHRRKVFSLGKEAGRDEQKRGKWMVAMGGNAQKIF